MMALYMPMQPSSKMPMMAFFWRKLAGQRARRVCSSAQRQLEQAAGPCTWLVVVGDRALPAATGAGRCRKNSSVKSSLHERAVLHARLGQASR